MVKYALLLAPSANRVYTQSAPALAEAEFKAFGGLVIEPPVTLGGLSYLVFQTTPERLAELGNTSSAYAFFELHDNGMLRPVEVPKLSAFDDDLITIPKYAGKTNEHFTKLLLNVTALASAWPLTGHKFTVLDPVAGRGTTLNQALMYGWDAIGIEIDAKDVEAYAAFVKTYLRRKKIKHTADTTPVRREGKRLGKRFDAAIEGHQKVTLFEADTVQARQLMKKQTADLIVGDLPYNVVHKIGSPAQLLERALPGWADLLRPGGAIGLSWNVNLAPREVAVNLLAGAGLRVAEPGGFEHWVDQGITRDIVVARKV
jgi:SAM-dependent methyltransferase